MESTLRSALIVAVPEAAAAVDGWRERTCAAKPSSGVPAHVTLLIPFVPASEIDDALVEHLGTVFGRFEPFAFELRATERFPTVLYLVPEPSRQSGSFTPRRSSWSTPTLRRTRECSTRSSRISPSPRATHNS